MTAGNTAEATDEQYVAGLTYPELRDYFTPELVQSLRENPLWRQPGYVQWRFALDYIDALELQIMLMAQQYGRLMEEGQ